MKYISPQKMQLFEKIKDAIYFLLVGLTGGLLKECFVVLIEAGCVSWKYMLRFKIDNI